MKCIRRAVLIAVVCAGWSVEALAAPKLVGPTNLTALAVSSSRIDLTWRDKSTSESGFNVQRAPDMSGAPGAWVTVGSVGSNVTRYADTNLAMKTKYWYRVFAYSSSKGNSSYSNAVSAATKSPASISVSEFPSPTATGRTGTVAVKVLDSGGLVVSNYPGRVHFSSTDAQAVLPSDPSLSGGTGSFPVTLNTPGSHSITATDLDNGGVSGSQTGIDVCGPPSCPASQLAFSVQPPGAVTAGEPFAVQPQVTFRDAFGNTSSSGTSPVTLTAYSNASCSTPASVPVRADTNPLAPIDGTAAFSGVNHTDAGGNSSVGLTIFLGASASGVTTACSSSVQVFPGSASRLGYLVQPSSLATANMDFGGAGGAVATQVVVQNAYGNKVSSSLAYGVTLSAYADSTCSLPASGTVSSASSLTLTGNVIAFVGTNYSEPGDVYLQASSPGLSAACSDLVSVAAAPVQGTWIAIPAGTPYAPSARSSHSIVWTGSTMIVWGGSNSDSMLNDGAAFDPVTTSWSPIAVPTIPARQQHTTVWAGSQMIVWGGYGAGAALADGGMYDPAPDSWTVIPSGLPNAPAGRWDASAVWTGTRMIVWGGGGAAGNFGDGGMFDPATGTWTAIPAGSPNAPPALDYGHVAVWTGSHMIVWGTASGRTWGAAFDPSTGTWTAIPTGTPNEPSPRSFPFAVWTGSRMIVWGGGAAYALNHPPLADGGMLDPSTGSWTPIPAGLPGAPSAREGGGHSHHAVWPGSKMVVWGGDEDYGSRAGDGGIFDPDTVAWSGITLGNPGEPGRRLYPGIVWTGSQMLVWGGMGGVDLQFADGGILTPP